MITDMSAVIEECSVDLQATRFKPAIVANGRVIAKPSAETISFRGSFQPLSGKELMRLPEGMRNRGRAKLYTTIELRTVETSDCDIPDRICYRGVTYQVVRVADWSGHGKFYRVELERMDR